MARRFVPCDWKKVRFGDGFWRERRRVNSGGTIPAAYEQLRVTGRIDALHLRWRPGNPKKPHHYWDSDVAKWIEAAAYSLGTDPDPQLEALVDETVELVRAAQRPDGYLNSYFDSVEPQRRWTNVYVMHELYCAGHLTEAAVAYFDATGKRSLLDVMIRYCDHIISVFGPGPGQIRGYPGHEELELALVRLYRATGQRKYLDQAAWFLDERGKQPYFFESEARARGEDPALSPMRELLNRDYLVEGPYALFQAHKPVREQTEAVGHAVRAMYLYSAMVDTGMEKDDPTLLEAARRLWRNVTRRRMSLTGGVGPLEYGERFTYDWDLPNDTAYNETCAAIGLVFWASRLLQDNLDGEYGDVLEQALYNGVLSGVSLKGDTFFYANHLEADPGMYVYRVNRNVRMLPRRQPWFEVCCCPTNLARLVASLGSYMYSTSPAGAPGGRADQAGQMVVPGLQMHLYARSEAKLQVGAVTVAVRQDTDYPWDGAVRVSIDPDSDVRFSLSFRVPGWARKATARIRGESLDLAAITMNGYATITRTWCAGDVIDLDFAMEPYLVEAHPAVRQDCGKVAIMRGPLVYCLEGVDNGERLWDVALAADARLESVREPDLLGGVVCVMADALVRNINGWDEALYRPAGTPLVERRIRAVPYYAWSNRDPGQMVVWMRSLPAVR